MSVHSKISAAIYAKATQLATEKREDVAIHYRLDRDSRGKRAWDCHLVSEMVGPLCVVQVEEVIQSESVDLAG